MGMVANEAIKAIKGLGHAAAEFGKAHTVMGAGINVAHGAYTGGFKSAMNALNDANGNFSYGRAYMAAATGMTALRFGFGGIKGTFSDSDGNLDLPGVPFI